LEKSAQSYAKMCIWAHDKSRSQQKLPYRYVGQNMNARRGIWFFFFQFSNIKRDNLLTIGEGNRSTREEKNKKKKQKTLTGRKSPTSFIAYCCIEYTSPRTGIELTTLEVIGKSSYHMITTTTAPNLLSIGCLF
jgi:hypothetical protein